MDHDNVIIVRLNRISVGQYMNKLYEVMFLSIQRVIEIYIHKNIYNNCMLNFEAYIC